MKKIRKKITALAFALMSFVSLCMPTFAAEPLDGAPSVEALLNKRDSVSVSLQTDRDLGMDTSDLEAELNNINEQLDQMGVESLTTQEVLERYGEENEISPYSDSYYSNNIVWNEYTSDVSYNGVSYKIKTLTATIKTGYSSILWERGNVTLKNRSNWEAGALEVFGLTANRSINLLCNQNPVSKVFKTVYDYASAFFSGYSSKTIIKDIEASYVYNAYTAVSFKDVSKKGDSDIAKPWTYIATKCEVVLNGNFPVDNNGHPDIVSYKNRISANQDAYNNNTYAINAYNSPACISRNYVEGLNLYGLEGRKLTTVSTIKPEYAIHIT